MEEMYQEMIKKNIKMFVIIINRKNENIWTQLKIFKIYFLNVFF